MLSQKSFEAHLRDEQTSQGGQTTQVSGQLSKENDLQ
jgi:hypothetical protein